MRKVFFIIMVAWILCGCQEVEEPLAEVVPLNEETSYIEERFVDTTLTHYDIDAVLNDETQTIDAKQKITYTNREIVDLDALYIHLYPNAFSEEGQPSIAGNTSGLGDDYGAIEVDEIFIDGKEVVFEEGPTLTSIKIPYDFKQDETYDIQMSYTIKVSSTTERFGYSRGIYNLGNWYPVLAVYDEDGWNVDPYLSIGDPFYSDMANYDVSIEVPLGHVVASSGYLIQREDDRTSTYKFRGNRMRDFAMVISDRFEILERTVNDTTVMLYFPESIKKHKWINDALGYGADSIEFFEEIIGDYPYKTYSVVLTNFPSGMEYPGLVLISQNYLTRSKESLKEVIVHETAHQWFYGIIGDDEIDEGWIDEGLTSYYTAFFDKFYQEGAYEMTMSGYQNRVDHYGFDNVVVAQSAYEFDGWDGYGVSAYSKSALVYHELYKLTGDDKMKEFAAYLYEHYAYDILKEEDLRKAIVDVFGQAGENIIDTWWY